MGLSGEKMLLVVTLLIHLHLSSTQGQDRGGSDPPELIFTRPGSHVTLTPRYNLTLDKDNRNCDGFEWTHESLRIYRSRNCRELKYNISRFSNYKTSEDGRLILINVTRNNSGEYKVTVTETSGHQIYTHYILQVQEPVSEPFLNVLCLPDGGANISCRTDTGTDPLFSITVNGDVRLNSTSSRTVRDVSEVHVPADSPGPWDITCSVRNGVSENKTKKAGETCPVPPSHPILSGLCLHDGRREISCSVENGSDPVFSLSVNGTLMKNVRKEQKGVNVLLSSSGPWDVHCSVTNDLGTKNETRTFWACPVPPSVPVLKISCHNGNVEISCSVENGSDPVFSLSVNGTLMENVTEEQKGVNVTLSSSGPWDVHCSVTNDLGTKNETRTFRACEAPLSAPTIIASCLGDGSARVVCLVEDGRNVTYNWTVHGKFLLWHTAPNLTVNTSEFTSGAINIDCSAGNSISKKQSNVTRIFCEAPLSAPTIITSCLGDGSARVICLVEDGRNVTYNWTVDGTILLSHTAPNLTINGSNVTSGATTVSCSVQNSISKQQSNVINVSCEGCSSSCLWNSLIGGLVALTVTTCPLFIASYYIGRDKKED